MDIATAPTPPATSRSGLPGPWLRVAIMGVFAVTAVAASSAPRFAQPTGTGTSAAAPPGTFADVAAPTATSPAGTPGPDTAPTAPAVAPTPAPTPTDDVATGGSGTTPSASAGSPASSAPATTAPAVGAATDAFADSTWLPMSGTWEQVGGGAFLQTDPNGFDFIMQSESRVAPPYTYRATMLATSPELGGGLILGQPQLGERRGAWIVDFTGGGSFLRWGRYDPTTGVYTYLGGLDIGTDASRAHTVEIVTTATATTVRVDGATVGSFDPVDEGHIGLVTSMSSIDFSDVALVLP